MSDYDQQKIKNSFAKVYGSAGEAPKIIGLLKAFWPLLFLSLIFGYMLRVILPFPYISFSFIGIFLVLISLMGIFLLVKGNRKLENYLKGAKGEEWVASQLAFLNSDHVVFNGMRLNKGKNNFDHIVLGPSCIFIIETKNWSGEITFSERHATIDGKSIKYSPLNQVKEQSHELISFLNENKCNDIPVKPVLCFIESKLKDPVSNINGVIVCSGNALIDVITDQLMDPINDEAFLNTQNILKSIIV
tara:strand:- start:195 stop:932 length:738 start_codon:yes stop_codon:yes gene_type:complete